MTPTILSKVGRVIYCESDETVAVNATLTSVWIGRHGFESHTLHFFRFDLKEIRTIVYKEKADATSSRR